LQERHNTTIDRFSDHATDPERRVSEVEEHKPNRETLVLDREVYGRERYDAPILGYIAAA